MGVKLGLLQRMRKAGHVARMGDEKWEQNFGWKT
jgi:hypothetical protein